jgi:MerR family transcriptional regulator, redox-sensitive transcriptional activator SoxR
MDGSNGGLTIGEVARRTDVPASTLRYWESVGVLPAPERVGGKRRYGGEDLRQISAIVLSKRAGLTLSETRIILSGLSAGTPPSEIWRELANRKLPEINQKLAEAAAMKKILEQSLSCHCLTLDECITQRDVSAMLSLDRETRTENNGARRAPRRRPATSGRVRSAQISSH